MKIKAKSTFIILLFFFSTTIFGQINIKGSVRSLSTNEPLPGVTILILNQNKGTTTDFDGNFQITIDEGQTLSFSYIGFETQQVDVNTKQDLNILLVADQNELEEIVVVGYGTQRKKEVTGAVSVLGSKEIEKINPVRVEQALQGQVAGVTVTSASGSPGSGANIRIRGISTNGDSRPLILVDGNIIEDLSVINPNDIKSINVLKDATAGIYGVQGANGVILIETKTGRKNSPIRINLDSYYGFQQTTKKIGLIDNAFDYATSVNNASLNGGGRVKFYPIESTRLVFNLTDPNNPIETFTDWQDAVFENAVIYNTNVGFNGGTEKLTYSFGASHLDQDGIVGLGKSNYTKGQSSI